MFKKNIGTNEELNMKVNQTTGNVIIHKKTPEPLPIAGGTGGSGGPSRNDGPGRPGGKGDSGWAIKTSTSIQSNIKKAIDAEPEIRTELVKNYKEQIKSGEYKIDPDEVASKMISDSLEEDLA